MTETIPKGLKSLVRQTLDILGEAIRQEYGKKTFSSVENVRKMYKKARRYPLDEKIKLNGKLIQSFKSLTPTQRFEVTHSFASSLELINACENAFQTHRLQSTEFSAKSKNNQRVTFVLTAHPTESRSPECISIFSQITEKLIQHLSKPQHNLKDEIYYLLLLALKIPMARNHKPEVKDEALYIYSSLLKKDIVEAMITCSQNGQPVFMRTWVGGDKDGHPGVNHKTMHQSLQLSRTRLIPIVADQLRKIDKDMVILDGSTKNIIALKDGLQSLKASLKSLRTLRNSDGKTIKNFHSQVANIERVYTKIVGAPSSSLSALKHLTFLFPGLVVPLELREDSELIHQALELNQSAIGAMLTELRKISLGGEPHWYVRGLVVSMTEKANDIISAARLMRRNLGGLGIPVIPLYENKKALDDSSKITKEILSDKSIRAACFNNWNNKFEIMLGYSDSSKENGSLASRSMIAENLYSLERVITSHGCTPIFFHGSGGSVARGGGSIEEQIAWWPPTARYQFKATIQGEMVYRSFATPELFKRQVQKIIVSANSKKDHSLNQRNFKVIKVFSDSVATKYRELINNPTFLEVVAKATPYAYLDQLKIGSRPTKRKAGISVDSLRAIPWVLCWTQTRALLPVWWGIGATWKNLDPKSKIALQNIYKESSFLKSYVKVLAFTLSKVEPSVALTYLRQSSMKASDSDKIAKAFLDEYRLAKQFVSSVSGQTQLLWFRPWLKESISLRSTMIHPINLMQILAIETKDQKLLRETVTGIASGMLTTG